jgi:hypothetical protein
VASFDFSELNKLAADLGEVSRTARPNVRKAVQVTAHKVRDSWREKLQGSATLPGLPAALSYDVESNAGGVEAEVGFDKQGQGNLGVFSEYGSVNNAPRGFGLASLEENQADFVKGILMAVDESLDEGNL